MDGWMDGWMDKQMDGWMTDGQKSLLLGFFRLIIVKQIIISSKG